MRQYRSRIQPASVAVGAFVKASKLDSAGLTKFTVPAADAVAGASASTASTINADRRRRPASVVRICSSFRQPADLANEAPGFAPPPGGGFAFVGIDGRTRMQIGRSSGGADAAARAGTDRRPERRGGG